MGLGRVLVIDDNAYARHAICLILTKAGYEVAEAEVICDLEMPHVSGSQTISYFRSRYPLIPLVILTGASDFVLTEVLRNHGVTDYLLKPVSEKRLLEVVRVNVRLHELRQRQA